jgi:hypothetical protein
MLRRANIWLTATGVLVFSALLWFVHGTPDRFDRAVGEVVVSEVGDRLHAVLLGQPGAPSARMEDLAARLPGRLGEEVSARLSAVERLSKPDAMEIAWRVLAAVCECKRSGATPPDLEQVVARVSSGLGIDLADAQAELAQTEERIRVFALGSGLTTSI